MTTSTSTTFSPSRRRMTRSTPCVLGCCGPMLITSSLVSNMAPWWIVGVSIYNSICDWDWGFGMWDSAALLISWVVESQIPNPQSRTPNPKPLSNLRLSPALPQLQPVDRILHQQLARSFERIVLPLRKALPVLGHQDAAAVGMSGEVHAEHVIDLALEPVRCRPQ